ncbi:MAG: hypothetical protein M3347_00805 [Armatimonadota bacterium]|nr:hypothetical protein [Armatimonadota bacterium]
MNTRFFLRTFVLALTVWAAGQLPVARAAESYRYWLAAQQEFGARRGFSLVFENTSQSGPHKLETLKLLLAVADGKTWRFPGKTGQWQWDHDYAVKAVAGPKGAELWLDGQRVAQSGGGFMPSQTLGLVRAGLPWKQTSGTAEYVLRHTALRLSSSGGQILDVPMPGPESPPLPLFLFDPQVPVREPLTMKEGETLTIEATFRLVRNPGLEALAPFVDRYGQSRHADWPTKIRTDDDLQRVAAEEQRRHEMWGVPQGFDAYGGVIGAPWHETATGFFRTVRRNGYWWLISPEGNPCFYIGVCTTPGLFERNPITGREFLFAELPPRQDEYAKAWTSNVYGSEPGAPYVSFNIANLIRKYGAGWEAKNTENITQRLKVWGFSGVGKWSGDFTPAVPRQPVLRLPGVPNIARHPDIFDPVVRDTFREALRKNIEPQKNNPHIIGWSLGNEYDGIVAKSDIQTILAKAADVPAKRALVEHALNTLYGGDVARMAGAWKVEAKNGEAITRQTLEAATPQPPAEDIETLRRFFADQYYDFVYRTVKELDPNHLYLGFWIVPGWWENEEDWRLIARHCDVIGYDYYGFEFADERLLRLLQEADKPALCGEFSFPSWYRGERGYGVYGTWAVDDAAAGQLYTRWMEAAARNPYCVGLYWFQYRDQPLTGRGPGKGPSLTLNEHFAFGLIDVTDTPKWGLVEAMRAANLKAAPQRFEATDEMK